MSKTCIASFIALLALSSFELAMGQNSNKRNLGDGKECNPVDFTTDGVFNAQPNLPMSKQHAMFFTIIINISRFVGLSETPIAIRHFSLFDGSLWNCVAAYSNNYLDAFRRGQDPVVRVPKELTCDGSVLDTHTTDARAQCMVYMYGAAIPILTPDAVEGFNTAVTLITTDPDYGEMSDAYPSPFPALHPEINACFDEDEYADFRACVQQVAENHNYTPLIVGSAIAADMLHYDRTSGWNREGMDSQKFLVGSYSKGSKSTKSTSKSKGTKSMTPMHVTGGSCTYNCGNYSDTTGYVPRNFPGSSDKFKKFWQPLLENNGLGFFYRQEHVTPHIGFTTHPRVLSKRDFDSRTLMNPKYDLQEEAKKVTERLADITDEKKMQIELFDNKSTVAAIYYRGMIFRYGETFSFERVMLWLATFLGTEEDATLLAWKEKVNHDLVRPTTVIQQTDRYNTPEVITTFAGPGNGIDTFPAKDFQPYIRVMPHAEFPSGSACICRAGADAMYAYMETIFNDDASTFSPSQSYSAGSSSVEPGITPAEDIVLTYPTMEEFSEACGQSRLDGGMHFTAAVPEGEKLCLGFKPEVTNFIMELLNGDEGGLITTYVPSA